MANAGGLPPRAEPVAACGVGTLGLYTWPWPVDDPILGLIDLRRPDIYAGFQYAYTTRWFSTPRPRGPDRGHGGAPD
jgi:hypothetical protein